MRGVVSVYPATTPSTAPLAGSTPTSAFVVTVPTTAARAVVAEQVVGRSEQPVALLPVLATVVAAAALAIGLRRMGQDGLRVVAIVATLATGALHLQLRHGIDYPEPIGTLLVIEAGGAAMLAAWLGVGSLTRRKALVGIALHAAALCALGVTRTSLGLFGFHEFGWDPSPHLPLALTFGVVAIAALAIGTVHRFHNVSAVA
jgi:hypothetical protein